MSLTEASKVYKTPSTLGIESPTLEDCTCIILKAAQML